MLLIAIIHQPFSCVTMKCHYVLCCVVLCYVMLCCFAVMLCCVLFPESSSLTAPIAPSLNSQCYCVSLSLINNKLIIHLLY